MLPLSLVCFYEKREEVDREPLRLFSGARNRNAIRLADQSKVTPCFAGWDRRGIAGYSLLLIVNSLRLILRVIC